MALVSDLPDVEALLPAALKRCLGAAAPLEFESFLIGVRSDRAWPELPREEVVAWKRQLKRSLGRALEAHWPGRRVAFRGWDLLLTYDVHSRRVERLVTPLFLYGRYRKLRRGLPQTPAHWRCDECHGAGCEPCASTGLRHPRSLSDLLGAAPQQAAGATEAILHGMGREDIDVRCLGGGRPFVLELREPHRRQLDLAALSAQITREHADTLELTSELRPVSEDWIGRLKEWRADKRYRARIEAEGSLDPGRVAALSELGGVTLRQVTPARVAHRRVDKVRERTVRSCAPGALAPDGRGFEVEIEAQSGTYIKELISGDEGRTEPSFSARLGVACRCVELDVLEIGVSDAELFRGEGGAV